MDIQVPEIEGIDAAKLIKLHYHGDSSPKIIAYTAYNKNHSIP
jgi:CheY-like chemotaxis protein